MNKIDDAKRPLPPPRLHENPGFRSHIRKILATGEINEEHIDLLTDEKGMMEYSRAFTTHGVDNLHNYEFYEIMGDAISNAVVVWYFTRKFSFLFDTPSSGGKDGPVGILARLKIDGVSKTTYSDYSRSWGFEPYIRMTNDERMETTDKLEDVFEAFCGCTAYLIDQRVGEHLGYGVVYEMMKKLMDISTDGLEPTYENVTDPKSKINNEQGALKFFDFKYENNSKEFQQQNEDDEKDNYKNRFHYSIWIVLNRDKLDSALSRIVQTHGPHIMKELDPIIQMLKKDHQNGVRYGTGNIHAGANRKEAETKAAGELIKTDILPRLHKLIEPIIKNMPPPKTKAEHLQNTNRR